MKNAFILLAMVTFGFIQIASAQNRSAREATPIPFSASELPEAARSALELYALEAEASEPETLPGSRFNPEPLSVCVSNCDGKGGACCCNISNGHESDCALYPNSTK